MSAGRAIVAGMKDQPPTIIEIVETPLALDGAPELAQSRLRRLPCDDIASVFADTAHSGSGWHPLCVLQLFGGEEIMIALPAELGRGRAHTAALELAAQYQLYLPSPTGDEFDASVDDARPRVCAACGSSVARPLSMEGSPS